MKLWIGKWLQYEAYEDDEHPPGIVAKSNLLFSSVADSVSSSVANAVSGAMTSVLLLYWLLRLLVVVVIIVLFQMMILHDVLVV